MQSKRRLYYGIDVFHCPDRSGGQAEFSKAAACREDDRLIPCAECGGNLPEAAAEEEAISLFLGRVQQQVTHAVRIAAEYPYVLSVGTQLHDFRQLLQNVKIVTGADSPPSAR